MQKGFTLIELLVVVLIIGILAAVALPQYTKAVEKSRAVGALAMGRAVMDAQEVYYLANGEYASSVNDLDIGITCPDVFSCIESMMSSDYKYEINRQGGSFGNYHLIFNFSRRPAGVGGKIYCWANTAKAIELCKTFGNTSVDWGDGHTRVIIQ